MQFQVSIGFTIISMVRPNPTYMIVQNITTVAAFIMPNFAVITYLPSSSAYIFLKFILFFTKSTAKAVDLFYKSRCLVTKII